MQCTDVRRLHWNCCTLEMTSLFLLRLFMFCTCLGLAQGTEYFVAAKGQILCAGKPVSGAKVEMWEKDPISR